MTNIQPITFVSLGPGDPELITLKALRCLQNADCVLYPITLVRGVETSRALELLRALEIDEAKLRSFIVPMSKNRIAVQQAYAEAAQMLMQWQTEGLKTVMVAEGDASFYSTTHHVYELISRENCPTLRIAGVPAFVAAGTLAQLHVAALEQELHVIPGTVNADQLASRLDAGESVVVMKTSLCEAELKRCIGLRPEAKFHYFENVGLPEKEFYTAEPSLIAERKFPYFSIMIIQSEKS